MARTRTKALAAIVVAAIGTSVGVVVWRSRGDGGGGGSGRLPSRPSIVIILTDDQRWDMLAPMTNVRERLAGRGVTFSNGFVVNSLCCPSRASILTGQWSHSTGVYRNTPPHGGFSAFRDTSTVATWLHGAGYTTGLVGKYLNGYSLDYRPPGWDRWVADRGRDYYYDYDLDVDGTVVHHGHTPADYSTNVLADAAVSFVQQASGPIFLYFAPHAPHQPAPPAPGDENAPVPRLVEQPPNFNEADVSDKPGWVRRLPLLTPQRKAKLARLRNSMNRSLLAVDRAVGRILDALQATGRLGTTFVAFLSDNGLAFGEHRWDRKQVAYEESIRIPYIVRFDPLTSEPRTDRHFALNVDLAPTAADLAGVKAPGAEGRSLIPLLRSSGAPWRTDFLIEHERLTRVPSFCALRTERYLYVLYQTNLEELYDLEKDPFELDNAAADPELQDVRRDLHARVLALCRPLPPDWSGPP